jgi:cell division transport system permease protein
MQERFMSLNRFISFSIPLIVLLFTFFIYISINKIILNYNTKINKDYSIVVVSITPIIASQIKNISSNIKTITHLKRENILKNLDKDISSNTYKLLKQKLPYFYTLSLYNFPTSSNLIKLKKELKKISGIKRIETFSKNHDQIYSLLLLIKTIVMSLFFCIIIFTFLVTSNNIQIWFYEHKQRLNIIKLHGGSLFYGAKPIIKTALFSSIFSSFVVILFMYIFKENLDIFLTKEIITLISSNLTTYTSFDILLIFILSFMLSLLTVIGILLKHKFKQ